MEEAGSGKPRRARSGGVPKKFPSRPFSVLPKVGAFARLELSFEQVRRYGLFSSALQEHRRRLHISAADPGAWFPAMLQSPDLGGPARQ